MRFHKKGSLELSVNAIVIIILAIALLGLGLMFVRNFLGAGSEQLMKNMLNVEIQNPASSIEPITATDVQLQTGGKAVKVPIGFYCSSASTCKCATPVLSCEGALGEVTFQAFTTSVNAHASMGYIALLTPDSGVTSETSDVCTISIQSFGDNPVNCGTTALGTQPTWTLSKQITITQS